MEDERNEARKTLKIGMKVTEAASGAEGMQERVEPKGHSGNDRLSHRDSPAVP